MLNYYLQIIFCEVTMTYTKERLEKDRVNFTVEVSAEEWNDAITDAYPKPKKT